MTYTTQIEVNCLKSEKSEKSQQQQEQRKQVEQFEIFNSSRSSSCSEKFDKAKNCELVLMQRAARATSTQNQQQHQHQPLQQQQEQQRELRTTAAHCRVAATRTADLPETQQKRHNYTTSNMIESSILQLAPLDEVAAKKKIVTGIMPHCTNTSFVQLRELQQVQHNRQQLNSTDHNKSLSESYDGNSSSCSSITSLLRIGSSSSSSSCINNNTSRQQRQQQSSWRCGRSIVGYYTQLFSVLLLMMAEHFPNVGASTNLMSKHEPMFISRSETFKFVAGDTIRLPCEVANT
ncbi:PREDICTED: uncharacterized protein LOC108366669, partial [Rhagoletis zephyria]|uniref:uncharacterized protein LOC108366669 n=1 Tax=Rhagoletis zephyria TaxID=28612 RepID=UPI00081173DB